jgi:hypothetical protein
MFADMPLDNRTVDRFADVGRQLWHLRPTSPDETI